MMTMKIMMKTLRMFPTIPELAIMVGLKVLMLKRSEAMKLVSDSGAVVWAVVSVTNETKLLMW